MKKQLTAILVLTVTFVASAFASPVAETGSSSRKIILQTGFQKIVADGNVDVVLFENSHETQIRTFGNSADLAATSITEEGGVLTIRNTRNKGEKVLVYVPVNKVSVIEARGNSKISSATTLASPQLTLVVKGDCRFNIQSSGTIDVVENDEVEVVVEKKITALKRDA